jgi:threonine dehydrogenase-like Zn-dependent dehydrogenase
VGRQGAFAERITLPQENLVKVPDNVSSEDAVYAEPLAAALRIQEQTRISSQDRVAVLGDGRLGQLVCGVGSTLNWDLTLVGLDPEKMKKAAHLVASHYLPNDGPAQTYDLVVDCTGSPRGIKEALRLLKPQGRLVLKTTTHESLLFNFSVMVIHEIQVIGSRCGSMEQAVAFLTRGIFKPSVLTSARFPLSQGDRAFEAAMEPGQLKVILEMPMKQ